MSPKREADPRLQPFVNGVAVLRRDGVMAGHIASTVGWFWSPSRPLRRQPWVWFLVIWADGERELPFEDYPPKLLTVSEIEAGRFTWDGGSWEGEYTAELLGREQASEAWRDLGISVEDF